MTFDPNAFDPLRPLRERLKVKSRGRREALKRSVQAEQSTPRRRNDLTPQLELVNRCLADLVMPSRNVRSLDPAHIREVASSISTLGFAVPVLIDQDNRVLNGAVRIEAARLLGLLQVPCVVARHLSATEQRLLRVAVNRLQEKADGIWTGLSSN